MENAIIKTPATLAAEINVIKEQTARQVLAGAIAIGERLEQAKTMVSHGEWETWLHDNVDYSQSTAQNLMRIAREYGGNQMTLSGKTNSEIYAALTYSQAVALFAIPAADREEFLEENDATSMSTREFQEAIAAKKKAEERAQQAEDEVHNVRERLAAAQKEANAFKTSAAESNKSLREANQKASELAEKNKNLAVQVKSLTEKPAEITEEQKMAIVQQAEEKYAEQISQMSLDADAAQRTICEKQKYIERLEKQIQTSSDANLHKFNALFEQWQHQTSTLLDLATIIGGDKGAKLMDALRLTAENIFSER